MSTVTSEYLTKKYRVCEAIAHKAKTLHKFDNFTTQNEKYIGYTSACIGIAVCMQESALMKGTVNGGVDFDKSKPETVEYIMAFHQDVSWYFGYNALEYIKGADEKKQEERIAKNKDKWTEKVEQAIYLWETQLGFGKDIDLDNCQSSLGSKYEDFINSIYNETAVGAGQFFSKSGNPSKRRAFLQFMSGIDKKGEYIARDKGSIISQHEFLKGKHFPKDIDDFNAKKNNQNYKPYCDIIVAISMTQGWENSNEKTKKLTSYDRYAAGFYTELSRGGGIPAYTHFFENIPIISDWLFSKYAEMNPEPSDLIAVYKYDKAIDENLTINKPQGIWKLFNLDFWNRAPTNEDGEPDYFSNIELLQLMDISYASTIGSIKTFFKKIIQDPFVHGFGDSNGLMYNYTVRLKPFIEELWHCLPYYVIDKTNVIKDQLTWETESYSWYRLIPVGNFFGNTTRAVDYLNSFFFPEYAKVFGNNVLDQTCNYVTYDISKNSGETVQQNSIFLLKYMIACHCYLPFTRRGEITINYNPEIKIGNRVLNVPTNEMFYIDSVRHIQRFGDKPIEMTILGVSRGMELGDDDYWNLINYNEKTEIKKVRIDTATSFGTQASHEEEVFYFNDDMWNLDIDFDSLVNGIVIQKNNMSDYITGVDKEIPFNLAIEYFCERFISSYNYRGTQSGSISLLGRDYLNRVVIDKKDRKFPSYSYFYKDDDKTKNRWSVGGSYIKSRYFLNSNLYNIFVSVWKSNTSYDKKFIPYVISSYSDNAPVIVSILVNKILKEKENQSFEAYLEYISTKMGSYIVDVFTIKNDLISIDLVNLKNSLKIANEELCGANENNWFIDVVSSVDFTKSLYQFENPIYSNSFDLTNKEVNKIQLPIQKYDLKDNCYSSFKSIMNHKRTVNEKGVGDGDMNSDSNTNKNSLFKVRDMITKELLFLNIFNEPSEIKRQEGIKSLKGLITIVSSVSSEGFSSSNSIARQGELYDERMKTIKGKIADAIRFWYSDNKSIIKNETNKATIDYLLDYTNNKDNCIFRDGYDSSLGNIIIGKDIRKLPNEELLKFVDEADLVENFKPIDEKTTSYSLSQQFVINPPEGGQIMNPKFKEVFEDRGVKVAELIENKSYFDPKPTEKPALYMAALHHDFRSVRVFWKKKAKEWEATSDSTSGEKVDVEITTTNYNWHVNRDVFLRLINKKHKKDGFSSKITQKNSPTS